tara:strand:- start:4192 stop:4644 length:453 start_codon:yes stop_codon:yes gene_type:complete
VLCRKKPDDPGSNGSSLKIIKWAAKVRAAPSNLTMVKSKIEKLGSAKRFGARYGSKPKHKFAKIEKEQRKKHKCPYCNYTKVKRIVVGIWHCRKCDSKFTGKAYTIAKTTISDEGAAETEEKVQEQAEQPSENKKAETVKEKIENVEESA